MNRKTMLKRLKVGDDPIDVSISKWQDIRKKVEQGKIVGLDSIGCDRIKILRLIDKMIEALNEAKEYES